MWLIATRAIVIAVVFDGIRNYKVAFLNDVAVFAILITIIFHCRLLKYNITNGMKIVKGYILSSQFSTFGIFERCICIQYSPAGILPLTSVLPIETWRRYTTPADQMIPSKALVLNPGIETYQKTD
jgi:hypothetical protein